MVSEFSTQLLAAGGIRKFLLLYNRRRERRSFSTPVIPLADSFFLVTVVTGVVPVFERHAEVLTVKFPIAVT